MNTFLSFSETVITDLFSPYLAIDNAGAPFIPSENIYPLKKQVIRTLGADVVLRAGISFTALQITGEMIDFLKGAYYEVVKQPVDTLNQVWLSEPGSMDTVKISLLCFLNVFHNANVLPKTAMLAVSSQATTSAPRVCSS